MGKGIRQKLPMQMITVFMTLVFFYLVIGDLITFHQKAIFDYDIFAGQPFSKPHKSENFHKVKDKNDRVQINLLTFISDLLEINDNQFFPSEHEVLYFSCSIISNDIQYSSISYRGPPASLFPMG